MNNQKKKTYSALLIIALVFTTVKYFTLTDYLTFSYLHKNMHFLQSLIHQHYFFSVCCYMLSFITATAFSIPGSSIFTIAAGLLFGWSGLVYVLLAATLGATLLFCVCRYLIGEWIQQKYAHQLIGFNHEMQEYGHYYLLILRLVAMLPFCLVTMLSSFTLISLSRFALMTIIGLIPVSSMYIFAGIQLSNIADPNIFMSPPVMVSCSFFLLFKIALAPIVFKMGKRVIFLMRKKKRSIISSNFI